MKKKNFALPDTTPVADQYSFSQKINIFYDPCPIINLIEPYSDFKLLTFICFIFHKVLFES